MQTAIACGELKGGGKQRSRRGERGLDGEGGAVEVAAEGGAGDVEAAGDGGEGGAAGDVADDVGVVGGELGEDVGAVGAAKVLAEGASAGEGFAGAL